MGWIESIVLENFQSIRDRTVIPLRPITLLYGPNSAGKSAIYDAFLLLNATFGSAASENEVELLVDRWTHKRSHDEDPLPIKIEINISELNFWSHSFDDDLPESLLSDDLKNDLGKPQDVRLSVSYGVDSCDGITIELFGGDVNIFRFSDAQLTLNFDFFGGALDAMNLHDDEGSTYETASAIFIFGWNNFRLFGSNGSDRAANMTMISHLASHMLEIAARCIRRPQIISADRGTIKNNSMTGIYSSRVDCDPSCGRFWSPPTSQAGFPPWFASGVDGDSYPEKSKDSFIGKIAISRLEASLRERFTSIKDKLYSCPPAPDNVSLYEARQSVVNQITQDVGRYEKNESLFDFVNRQLRSDLFTDRGYQLAFDLCEILPPADAASGVNGSKYRGGDFDSIDMSGSVEVGMSALMLGTLIDNGGRRLRFEDVGTGLSCVVPVLVGLYSNFSFIQQPELHLHPALQSALGDVCIEAALPTTKESVQIIETHSEHLLLRILKRIRQSGSGKLKGGASVAVDPYYVAVLYFDPQPDGSTKVKRIRITEDGEFIDRWPKGFFEERGKELFDE